MKIIPITGMIGWDTTAADVRNALKEADGGPVKMVVTSGGGFVSAGFEMFNAFKAYPGEVHAELAGYAMSMGSYVPLAADKGKITVRDNAIFMVHEVTGGMGGRAKDLIRIGKYMQGQNSILAARYAKHTGKPVAEFEEMMDEETFFFGQEIVDAGFADTLIDSDESDESSSEGCRAMAYAAYEEIQARMSQDPEAAKADMQRAAAMINEMQPTPVASIEPPAAAGKIKEDKQMGLVKFLSENPAAKAEHEGLLVAAKADGRKEGHDAMAATVAKVAPYIGNAAYPELIGKTALGVLTGDSTEATLIASVAAVDAVNQQAASKGAAGTGTPETPGVQTPPAASADGVVASDADLDAEVARYKEG